MERSLGEYVAVFICGSPGQRNSGHACFLETTHGQESKPLFPLSLQIDFFVVFVSCVH